MEEKEEGKKHTDARAGGGGGRKRKGGKGERGEVRRTRHQHRTARADCGGRGRRGAGGGDEEGAWVMEHRERGREDGQETGGAWKKT